MRYKKKHIIFVDDEPQICKAVEQTLSRDFDISCFESAHKCLEALSKCDCDLLITDINMPGISGLELLAKVKRTNPALPVLVVTGYGEVPLAVRTMKAGAADFIQKPLDRENLLHLVRTLTNQAGSIDPLIAKKLTDAEKQILRLIVSGKTNKGIALHLHRSVRTVEQHRSHIMRKLDVINLAGLVKIATGMDLS